MVKALASFWFSREIVSAFPKASLQSIPLFLFCSQTAASSSHSIVSQAQTGTAPGNQLELLMKMKQLQISKDSVTLKDSETLAEGISAPSDIQTTLGGTGPIEMTFKFVDKDRSPRGNGSA